MEQHRNNIIEGENGRPIVMDYFYEKTDHQLPVVIFCHGFKGFKDWGAWDLMGLAFAKAGYLFIKFNYSHNGGTAKDPIDFPDLEAFGNNNYNIEIRDTQRVLDWVSTASIPANLDRIHLIGHSRAGGITTLVTAKDHRITSLITLASVADYKERFPKGTALKDWKEKGVYYIKNGRTQQEMPLYYQFYQDFLEHEKDLDILSAAHLIHQPHLIIHGDADPTVFINEALDLHKASQNSELKVVRGGDHVFGASHPWKKSILPVDLQQVVQCSINFLNTL